MAKINFFLAKYRELISQVLPQGMADALPAPVIRRFVRIFDGIDDSRCQGMTCYPLKEIILTAFLAVLANASNWVEIEQFGHEKEAWLRKFLPFKNGTPSHDTFRRVFSLLAPCQVEKATVGFLTENISAIKESLLPGKGPGGSYRLICVDGKEERGTGRKYGTPETVRNLQTLHVYDASAEVCLFSKPIDSKTNEIPVAQGILRTMDLEGCIVTFDALHTQRETVAAICGSHGDYVGGLKGNQSGLLEDAGLTFSGGCLKELRKTGRCFFRQVEKAHGQMETRCYYMAKAAFGSARETDWENLRNFICLEKHVAKTGPSGGTTETRFYVTSLDDILLCAEAIRGHWRIENNLHWHLDYSFREGDNSTMDKNASANLSLLNKMCLALCKLAQPLMGKSSVRVIRKMFSWDLEKNLSLLLNSFNGEALRAALGEKDA